MPSNEANAALLQRMLIRDASHCADAPAFIAQMGLAGSSPEGAALEHQDSHRRLDRLAPISQPVTKIAREMAKIHARLSYDLLIDAGEEVTAVTEAALEAKYMEVIMSSSIAMLAQLFDVGIVDYGKALQV